MRSLPDVSRILRVVDIFHVPKLTLASLEVGLQDRKRGGPLFPESKEMEIMELLGLVAESGRLARPSAAAG